MLTAPGKSRKVEASGSERDRFSFKYMQHLGHDPVADRIKRDGDPGQGDRRCVFQKSFCLLRFRSVVTFEGVPHLVTTFSAVFLTLPEA
jgi:hypothetical protein